MRLAQDDLDAISSQLAAAGVPVTAVRIEPLAGGINPAWRLRPGGSSFFLKTTTRENAAQLAEENASLDALRAHEVLRLPAPVLLGETGNVAFLALEWLDLKPMNDDAQSRLGTLLATLHRVTAPQHGWFEDNHIGRTQQPNPRMADWCEFFIEHRLGFQLRLLEEKRRPAWLTDAFSLLEAAVAYLDHAPPASLLHGDLWRGNAAMCEDGEPVVFDPASFHGDRETDIAMTQMFGGFSPAFYSAYEAAWPLEEGWQRRTALYRLYHLLNHANMFGGGYDAEAGRLTSELLRTR